ncbi:MAG: hypothetical protein ACOCYZ_02515 [Halococcoides sp.]
MSDDETTIVQETRDVEQFLLDREVLCEAEGADDYELTDRADRAIRAELDEVDDLDDARERAQAWLGVDPSSISFTDDEAVGLVVDDREVGTYPSAAAIMADTVIASVLEEWIDDWEVLGSQKRGEIISGVRLFLEVCPACEDQVAFDMKSVESCCGSYQVAALICRNCGARLYESPPLDRFQ